MEISLDEIMNSFEPTEPSRRHDPKEKRPITIWLPGEYYKAYGGLQAMSRSRFSKKIRELIMAAIDKAGHSALA